MAGAERTGEAKVQEVLVALVAASAGCILVRRNPLGPRPRGGSHRSHFQNESRLVRTWQRTEAEERAVKVAGSQVEEAKGAEESVGRSDTRCSICQYLLGSCRVQCPSRTRQGLALDKV